MNFPRPRHPRTASPPPRRQKVVPADPRAGDYPRPDLDGTVAALVGIALTAFSIHGEIPSSLARLAAVGVLFSLGASMVFDLRTGGMRNLIRADLMAILAFYFLTLFEFLFAQPDFDTKTGLAATRHAILCVLLGFAGLLIGRHLLRPAKQPFAHTLTREIPEAWIMMIFWACVLIGYFHMLISVDFDVGEMVSYWMEPRFLNPWGRGKFGDWKALLTELGMLMYLIPPFAGIIIARRQRFHVVNLALVSLMLLVTIFYAFTGGTRYIFAAYLVTFLIAYTFALPHASQKELAFLAAGSAVLLIVGSYFMLQFREVGFKHYLRNPSASAGSEERTMFVDYNLSTICRLVEIFPKRHPYLGWEIPYQALIRPIPRAIWKGKPEGLSSSIEDAVGAEGWTVAATFAGEAYMAGGMAVIVIVGICMGAVTGWWNHLASQRNSEFGILIYASGFFAAVISMRSIFVFTTALLPTIAALVVCAYAARILAAQARRLLTRAALHRQRQRHQGPRSRPSPRP